MRKEIVERFYVPAWIGTESDLRSLSDAMALSCQEMYKAERREIEGRHEPFDKFRVSDDLERLDKYWSVRAQSEHRRLKSEVSGTLDEVLSETPSRDLASLTLTYPAYMKTRRVSVFLSRSGPIGGWCRVTGDDPFWVASTAGVMRSQLKTRRPGWGWMLTFPGQLVVYAVLWTALYMGLVYPFVKDLPTKEYVEIFALGSVVGILLGVVVLRFFLRWLLPTFEVLPSGASATGTTRLAWAGTILVGAVVGAIVAQSI